MRDYEANFVISPFSIWSLMVLLAEGAADQSFLQMERTLHLPSELTYLRTAYKAFQRVLVVNTSTVELAVNQAVFSDLNRPIDTNYATILRDDYEADHIPINFHEAKNAVKIINDHISERTRGKIQNVIKSDDLNDAQLLLTSTIFFKGQWKVGLVSPTKKKKNLKIFHFQYPFNTTFTTEQAFYRENGEYAGHVPMMYQRSVLPFATINDLEANVVELPYGKEDRLCMLLLLPRRNSSLTAVFDKLKNYNIARITQELHKFDNTEDYEETEIELTLPRFNIDSDLELRTVLEHLGITDIFDPAKSNLSKLSKQPTYVSRVFHKAIIEVNEEGTVAAALSGGTVSFKQTPIEFVLNRPFGFLITERQTNTLLFAGQIRHPLKG